MKKNIILWIIPFLLPFLLPAQGKENITGYYDTLRGYDPKPGTNRALDTLVFDYDKEIAERVLSLRPCYLENVMPSDFSIPDPPANSSQQTQAELNYLLHLQLQRSAYDIDASKVMAGIYFNPRLKPTDSLYARHRKNLFHIGRSIGTWFNPEDLPMTAELMANVWRDASYFIWAFKYKYARVRPYVLDPSIQNLEDTNWPAYPSGHAANSYINAYIYSELFPQGEPVFLRDAYDMAHSREILGVHFPSDAEASRIFARQFVDMLFKNDKFRTQLDEVRKEWSQKAKQRFDKPATAPATTSAEPASSGASKAASFKRR
jgi:acid phosphatase (class A)